MPEPTRPEAPEKSLERQIRAFHWVRLLAELPERGAGRPGEREAAARVETWLREIGFEPVARGAVPPRPRPGGVLACHAGLAAVGCALGGVTGFVLAAVAALGFRRERAGRGSPLARLLPAHASLVAAGRLGPRRPRRRVVLTATLDAPQAGPLFAGPAAGLFRAAQGGEPRRGALAWPVHLLDAAAVVTASSALGAEGLGIAAARGLLVAALLAVGYAGVAWARAPSSAGANDNASGVAATLTAAEQLAAQLPSGVELWCVATGGAGLGASGMAALLDAHPEWLSDGTLFVHFECVGGGALHSVGSEGDFTRTTHPPMATELARRVAAGGAYGEVTPVALAHDTAAREVARRGGQLLTLISLEPDGLPRRFRRADDRPQHLDAPTLIRAADFGCCVASAHLRGDAEPLAYV